MHGPFEAPADRVTNLVILVKFFLQDLINQQAPENTLRPFGDSQMTTVSYSLGMSEFYPRQSHTPYHANCLRDGMIRSSVSHDGITHYSCPCTENYWQFCTYASTNFYHPNPISSYSQQPSVPFYYLPQNQHPPPSSEHTIETVAEQEEEQSPVDDEKEKEAEEEPGPEEKEEEAEKEKESIVGNKKRKRKRVAKKAKVEQTCMAPSETPNLRHREENEGSPRSSFDLRVSCEKKEEASPISSETKNRKSKKQHKKKTPRKNKAPKRDDDLFLLDQEIEKVKEETRLFELEQEQKKTQLEIASEIIDLCFAHSMIIGIALKLLQRLPGCFYVESFFHHVQQFLGFEDHFLVEFGVMEIGFYDLEEIPTRLENVKAVQEVYETFWANATFSNMKDDPSIDMCHKYLQQVVILCEFVWNLLQKLILVRKLPPKCFSQDIESVRPDVDDQIKEFCDKNKLSELDVSNLPGSLTQSRISWPDIDFFHEPHHYFLISCVIWGISEGKCARCRKIANRLFVSCCCYSKQIICGCSFEDGHIRCLNASQSCFTQKINILDIAGEKKQHELNLIKSVIRKTLIESRKIRCFQIYDDNSDSENVDSSLLEKYK